MEKFIVVALTASLPNKFEQCQVIKEGDVIIATHSRVFGPDSKEACEKWMAENCGKPTPGTGSRPNQPGAPPNQPVLGGLFMTCRTT